MSCYSTCHKKKQTIGRVRQDISGSPSKIHGGAGKGGAGGAGSRMLCIGWVRCLTRQPSTPTEPGIPRRRTRNRTSARRPSGCCVSCDQWTPRRRDCSRRMMSSFCEAAGLLAKSGHLQFIGHVSRAASMFVRRAFPRHRRLGLVGCGHVLSPTLFILAGSRLFGRAGR